MVIVQINVGKKHENTVCGDCGILILANKLNMISTLC